MIPIQIPTTIDGQRVAALFPIIGGEEHDTFVEALVVLTNEDATAFTVGRYQRRNGTTTAWTPLRGDDWEVLEFTSLPSAVRAARKQAGWG